MVNVHTLALVGLTTALSANAWLWGACVDLVDSGDLRSLHYWRITTKGSDCSGYNHGEFDYFEGRCEDHLGKTYYPYWATESGDCSYNNGGVSLTLTNGYDIQRYDPAKGQTQTCHTSYTNAAYGDTQRECFFFH